MLGKLIKNEFKATARNFLPIYLVMVIVAIFMKVIVEIQNNAGGVLAESRIIAILSMLSVVTFFIAIMAVIFGTIVLIVKRFYDNMLKDEGYLTFTLPVSTGQHIVSKVFTSYVWVICSGIVIFSSVLILLIGNGEFFVEAGKVITQIYRAVNAFDLWGYVVSFVVLIIIGIYTYIMMGYTCLSVGQNFNKHRVAGAFITYIAIYMITQICNAIFMVFLFGVNFESQMETIESTFFKPYIIYILIFTIIEAIAFTIVTHFMLDRKLNLE